jgi:hypothetical protein
LDKKQITNITFADISKAFDTVWIKALILKLENYDINEKLLFWLKSYLSRRKQRVVIKDAISRLPLLLVLNNEGIPGLPCYL